jgi:hypothetical protein
LVVGGQGSAGGRDVPESTSKRAKTSGPFAVALDMAPWVRI